MFCLTVCVLVEGLTLWNAILIHNAVTQVREGVIEDYWRAQLAWIVNISCGTPLEPLNSQFFEETSIRFLFEI